VSSEWQLAVGEKVAVAVAVAVAVGAAKIMPGLFQVLSDGVHYAA